MLFPPSPPFASVLLQLLVMRSDFKGSLSRSNAVQDYLLGDMKSEKESQQQGWDGIGKEFYCLWQDASHSIVYSESLSIILLKVTIHSTHTSRSVPFAKAVRRGWIMNEAKCWVPRKSFLLVYYKHLFDLRCVCLSAATTQQLEVASFHIKLFSLLTYICTYSHIISCPWKVFHIAFLCCCCCIGLKRKELKSSRHGRVEVSWVNEYNDEKLYWAWLAFSRF